MWKETGEISFSNVFLTPDSQNIVISACYYYKNY